ncbi:sensor domain-containing diguanylate cyclase [Methylobacterium sp. CM6241]
MGLQKLSMVFRSARTWTALSVLAPVGMLVVSSLMLIDLRRDAWDKAEQTSHNLLQVIERDIARNVEIFDLSISAVVENLHAPGIDAVSPAMRQLILFDRASMARDMGVMLVINERGDVVEDAGAVPPRKGSYADREYFQAQRLRADRGLYIGKPIVSRLTGEPMLPFSRRVSKPDGSFGGVVLGSLKLTYFTRLFDQIGLGREGAINLYLRDGTRVMRYPYEAADIGVNIAGAPTFMRFASARNGSFVDISVRDGVERYYTFTQVGDLPLILNVALSTREVEAEWRAKALGIGTVVLILCGLTVALSLLFGRELRSRTQMQAELARLSETDTLTGLANRRRFDEAFSRACAQVARSGKPLSLLMIDADHFKRFNDRYGHTVGDEVLKGLARCLAASVHRPSDLVCRVGGEEFVLLLPDTDTAGALRVAEAVHTQIATLAVEAAGIGPGGITVSIGSATGTADARSLYARADAALYEAKAGGRNQTRCAPSITIQSVEKPSLRLVGR